MAEVKPNVVFTVPLVLEKIYSKMIVPMISRGALRWALAVPYLDRRIYAQIRNKLIEAFGGEFEEVIIGGAPFNAEVEDFLYKIKFPFTVGYGMRRWLATPRGASSCPTAQVASCRASWSARS